jgi:hypothetical protein
VKNLVNAIANGEEVTPLLAKLKAEETRKKDLLTELDRLNLPADAVNFDEARLKREIHQRITDAKGLLDRQRPKARQILRRLLDQPLQFEAFEEEGGKKGYKVAGKGSYLQLLPSPLVSPCVPPYRQLELCPQLAYGSQSSKRTLAIEALDRQTL